MTDYGDILHMAYPRATRRPRMSMLDRAAQFSPFAALTGYDAAIQETGRITETEAHLFADGLSQLDKKLQTLFRLQGQQPSVVMTYFLPDDRKSGGAYVSVEGKIKKVDPNEKTVLMDDGTVVSFRRIYSIESDVF